MKKLKLASPIKPDENQNENKELIKKQNVIIAPHPDDEIIGCYEILIKQPCIIIYTSDINNARKEEALTLRDQIEITGQFFLQSIPQHFINENSRFYFPDPTYELHPEHRLSGSIGEQLARGGFDVVFYTTNMNAPYIHEVEKSNKKEELLNNIYSSQNDLWKYEKKYILFEGRCKWIF